MKILNIKSLFLLNGLLESFAGIFLLMYPKYLLLGAEMNTVSVAAAKMYGLSVLCLGLISYMCFRNYKETEFFRKSFLVFTAFHILIAFQFYGFQSVGIVDHQGPFALHLTLGILFCISIVINPKADVE